MKICMAGLGSIGKRHVKNLIKVLKEREVTYEIDALRNSRTDLPDDLCEVIDRQYYSVEDLPDDYDILFVTNPTSCHYDTIKKTIAKTKHMFIEKPIFDSLFYKLESLPLRSDSVYYVACPLRHKSILRYVKEEILPREKVISARMLSSSYLPVWRQNVDYRNVYSAKKDMGGGVTKDLIHEWDYALYLFGKPKRVFHLQKHLSGLEIDSDDISVYMAEYPEMLLEIHLDYIGHKTERMLQLFTDQKRLDVDLLANIVYEYTNDEMTKERKFPEEDFYINEMTYFMDCIEREIPNINTVANAYDTLKIALTGG